MQPNEKDWIALNQLLEWLKTFDNTNIKPNYINVRQKIWELLPIEDKPLKQAQDDLKHKDSLIEGLKNQIALFEGYEKILREKIAELKEEKQKWFDLHYTETTRADLLQEKLKAKEDEIEVFRKGFEGIQETFSKSQDNIAELKAGISMFDEIVQTKNKLIEHHTITKSVLQSQLKAKDELMERMYDILSKVHQQPNDYPHSEVINILNQYKKHK